MAKNLIRKPIKARKEGNRKLETLLSNPINNEEVKMLLNKFAEIDDTMNDTQLPTKTGE